MFPLRDDNPAELTPILTLALIAVNVAAWLFLQGAGFGERFVASLCVYGAIPAELTGRIAEGALVPVGEGLVCAAGALGKLSLLTSMFMHGSWMHLIANMWFLWVFGNNIEDSMGHGRFLVFYLACGLLASAAHIAFSTDSAVPMVGASGAISGVMGAYIVLYPHVRVHTLVFLVFIAQVVALPAVIVLGLWFVYQFMAGAASVGQTGGGVAFMAHVGGFVAGLALIKLFERRKLVQAKREGRVLTRRELPPRERW